MASGSPKVDPANRQRIAQACDSCKKRKQKCNGAKPCTTCSKRDLTCVYGTPNGSLNDSPPQATQATLKRPISEAATGEDVSPQNSFATPVATPTQQSRSSEENDQTAASQLKSESAPKRNKSLMVSESSMRSANGFSGRRNQPGPRDIDTSQDVLANQEDEAEVYSNTRMLQDPTGRLLYIGDSAALSFLQLMRMIVDNVAGPSPFTTDPNRHKIVENTMSVPHDFPRTRALPDKSVAVVLVNSFFTHVSGLVEIFERDVFMSVLDSCYSVPPTTDPSWLCLLHLTFAIGLVMASPLPGSQEDAIIQKLRDSPVDKAEMFYLNAKELCDPSAGFEDAGFWSIQALTLMSVYMLTVSKRNAAYAYHGMAVRSAFALGLHRKETYQLYNTDLQRSHRNLWRTLFILDRFLATTLGRPTSIRESECSDGILTFDNENSPPMTPFSPTAQESLNRPLGLEAAVRSCQVIGDILERVYSKRKITTKLAQEIANACKGWHKILEPKLDHRYQNLGGRRQGIATLHVNLLFCHSIVLLTRPFFVFMLNKAHARSAEDRFVSKYKQFGSLERFANACVSASSHTIELIHAAHGRKHIPHRNPFVLYFLFASSLVVIANEFSALFLHPSAYHTMNKAITLMEHFAQHDTQGRRLLFILTSFRDVAVKEQVSRSKQYDQDLRSPLLFQPGSRPQMTPNNSPMETLFGINDIAPSDPFGSFADDRVQYASFPPTLPIIPSPGHHHGLPIIRHDSSSYHSSISFYDHHTSPHDSIYSLENFMGPDGGMYHVPKSEPRSDGSENAEIDFDHLWQWPYHGGLAVSNRGPVMNNGGGMAVSTRGAAARNGGNTVGLGISNDIMMEAVSAPVMHGTGAIAVQELGYELDDELLPLFGMPHQDFHVNGF